MTALLAFDCLVNVAPVISCQIDIENRVAFFFDVHAIETLF